MRLSGHGMSIDLPRAWDGLITRRPGDIATMHAASFELPPGDGEFASRAIAVLPDSGVLLVLTEYEQSLAGHGLFAPNELPIPLADRAFHRRAFTRIRPGRYGVQRFCTVAGRPVCLYVVIGTDPHPKVLAKRANAVLSTVVVEPKPGTGT